MRNDPRYRSGYGQAVSDVLDRVNECIAIIERAMIVQDETPTPEQIRELRAKSLALRWIRSVVKALKA